MIAAKAWLDRLATRIRFLPDSLSDRLLQHASSLFLSIFLVELSTGGTDTSII
ncbi:hypothetical protein [Hankyongella ginsenosidimutans]|uniref:hypothetical protein n=1 Tax=Hankyongella ginsenosidimutans TaxID=1763828 RepID=UPI003CCC528A